MQLIAIRLDLLELDAHVANVVPELQDLVALSRLHATLSGLALDEQPADPTGSSSIAAMCAYARQVLDASSRSALRCAICFSIFLSARPDDLLRDQADAALLEHPLLLVDHLAQVLDLGELIVELLPALRPCPR